MISIERAGKAADDKVLALARGEIEVICEAIGARMRGLTPLCSGSRDKEVCVVLQTGRSGLC